MSPIMKIHSANVSARKRMEATIKKILEYQNEEKKKTFLIRVMVKNDISVNKLK